MNEHQNSGVTTTENYNRIYKGILQN